MQRIELTIKNATHSMQFTEKFDGSSRVSDIIPRIAIRLGLPGVEGSGRIGHLFAANVHNYALYEPRLGLCDLNKSLEQSELKSGDTIIFHCRMTFSGTQSSIILNPDQKLSDETRLIIVEWKGQAYIVILPAQSTAQGGIEGSLLNYLVFAQIAESGGQTLKDHWTQTWCYYNTRSCTQIEAFNTTALLGNLLQHNDRVQLTSPEPARVDESLQEQIVILGEDDDILDEIHIE